MERPFSFRSLGRALLRRKQFDKETIETTQLDRCLSTLDLTALGIGSTLGLGVYVLAGQVASIKAGPAVVISFFIAAFASVLAGLCYAEFGARVPRAGSAYIYSYVTVGEFMAFVIGWNLVLEYVIGTASVARGYSGYIDALTGSVMSKYFREVMPMNLSSISPFPDFLAFAITMAVAVMLGIGVKESTRFNSIFTCLNLVIILYIIICGAFKANLHNWKLDPIEDGLPKSAGKGGFMPYGFAGMMKGAATCFYGFVGFDIIATTGEEARNPQRAIPRAVVASLTLIFLAYFGVSGIQTLMVPYYMQNNDASLVLVFDQVGWPVAKYIVSIGALAALSTSLLGAMFPLPRVLYAMGTDGVVFRFLASVHPRFKTPLWSTIISGVFAGGMAVIFNVDQLADMMSIGTLLAYSLVAISVLVLRFRIDESDVGYSEICEVYTTRQLLRQFLNLDKVKEINHLTTKVSSYLIWIICGEAILLNTLIITLTDLLFEYNWYAIGGIMLATKLIIATTVALHRQPRSKKQLTFRVPWLPMIPVLSVVINFNLMLNLSVATWIRFAAWMIAGLLIYGFYGFKNSTGAMNAGEKRDYFLRKGIVYQDSVDENDKTVSESKYEPDDEYSSSSTGPKEKRIEEHYDEDLD